MLIYGERMRYKDLFAGSVLSHVPNLQAIRVFLDNKNTPIYKNTWFE